MINIVSYQRWLYSRCVASNHIIGETKFSKGVTTLRVKKTENTEKSRLTFRPNETYQVWK